MNTITKSLGYLTLASTVLVGCVTATNPAKAEKDKGPNDLEIAHIAYTAGNIDIRYAHMALAISENPEIRQFAELMVRDHTAVNNKALALVSKLQITPQDNPTSQQLSQRANDIRNELAQLRGDAFDKRYAANELEYHKFVNNAVENAFIPNAKNEELKSLLSAALQTFKAHEGHASSMNKKVS